MSSYARGMNDSVGREIVPRALEGWVPAQAGRLISATIRAYNMMPIHQDWDWNDNAEQNSVKGAINALGAAIEKWAYEMTEWAQKGITSSGLPYSWAKWTEHADYLEKRINDMGGDFDNTELVKQINDTARVVYETIQRGAERAGNALESSVPWLALGIGGGLVALAVYKLK